MLIYAGLCNAVNVVNKLLLISKWLDSLVVVGKVGSWVMSTLSAVYLSRSNIALTAN